MDVQDIKRNSELSESVVEIVKFVKYERNFDKAAQIIIEKNITMTNIVERTLRIQMFELAKLCDAVLAKK
ncbi:hypothetical protein CPU12_06800 [Malaciobacter molluscorum LMG 25693]|uniref:Uncharacterized protein n=1 Tax=Malaciobacter molluscorum LMG 25693 TaxID=870501 RepID=A0A2G1DI57_9BACT|nr:hypothetical protein [Malaciobacter molluscorum]AXX92384.1 hypothetical protein AMOL_1409 [Malaciobacter molluscorum LMG 25693]PHO18167.1 hypothetical protein CPU12_06800 [Malaciobacter molluscorum LMG 25693]RXJ93956.1 hypothetical protein CRV00_08745 [Malaciobacter molluscorum]